MYDNKASHINWREQDLYGSSRLGMFIPNVRIGTDSSYTSWNTMGLKRYELANHLGNVMATITDRRLQAGTSGDTVVTKFDAEVVNAQDYNSFGSIMEGRQYSTADSALYRYGFNGKENDNDVGKGIGGEQDYGERIYDPRIGRFLSVDPVTSKFPQLTPYQFAGNSPIQFIDIDGLEPQIPTFSSKYKYGDNVALNAIKTVPNTATNLVNGGIGMINTFVMLGHELIFNTSNVPGELKNDAESSYSSAATYLKDAYNYHTKTPARQQLKDVGKVLTSAQNLENTLTLGVGLYSSPEIGEESYVSGPINEPTPQGMNNPSVRSAVNLGNKVHYDALNGSTGSELPSALAGKYPDTQFRFLNRGAKGADVEVVGGTHPSKYPGSTWSPANDFGDFKPNTPSGNRTFNRDIKSGKFPKNTEKLLYDPKTGKLQ